MTQEPSSQKTAARQDPLRPSPENSPFVVFFELDLEHEEVEAALVMVYYILSRYILSDPTGIRFLVRAFEPPAPAW